GRRRTCTFADGTLVASRYEITRFVARGGMGEVYQATDRFLSHVVALKTLASTSLDDLRAIARLKDEVTLARRVSHPNVCRILEFGLHNDPIALPGTLPLPFLTMDFLEGETLGQRIRRSGAMSTASTRTLLAQLIAGLEAIHAAGIVHRDFKSDNVLLVPSGPGKERAVVMDLGLARALDVEPRSLTGGIVVGTLDYMAPEQIDGARPTPAFDVYALGVVIYEMLTGRTPFADTGGLGAAVRKLSMKPMRPSRAGAPTDVWDDLVLRCLERAPGKRFTSVTAVGEALRALPLVERQRRQLPARYLRGALMVTAMAGAVGGSVRLRRQQWNGDFKDVAVADDRASTKVSEVGTSASTFSVSPPAVAVAFGPSPAATTVFGDTTATSVPRQRRSKSLPGRRRVAAALDVGVAQHAQDDDLPEHRAADLLEEAKRRLLDGDPIDACARGRLAEELSPRSVELQLFLGGCYMRIGRVEDGRAHYARYLVLAPDAPNAVFIRAILEKKLENKIEKKIR
ncbi:MAG TPA: serine/threonine-protein kinase, partial [Polyangia bacterium]